MQRFREADKARLLSMDVPLMKPEIQALLDDYIWELKYSHLEKLYKSRGRKMYVNIFLLVPLTFTTVYTYNMKEMYYFYGTCFIALIWVLFYIKAWRKLMKINKEIQLLNKY